MPNARYDRGRKLEYETAADLIPRGWIVLRMAGSHGAADLIAARNGQIPLVIQCKKDGKISRAERDKLLELATAMCARPLVAYWSKVGRAARTVAYRELTGLDTEHWWTVWTPDHALEAS